MLKNGLCLIVGLYTVHTVIQPSFMTCKHIHGQCWIKVYHVHRRK